MKPRMKSSMASRLVIGASVSLISLGCGGDTTSPSAAMLAQQYWALMLNHHAITLALIPPYNTLQLIATPQTTSGTALVDTSTTTYTVSDTSVRVSASGVLTAIAAATDVQVIATHTIGNLTLTDTARVDVNDVNPVPTFTTFTLQPQPGDSARFTLNGADVAGNTPSISANVFDAHGTPIPNVHVRLTSANPAIVDVSAENLGIPFIGFSNEAGHVLISAEATVYGVSRTASLIYTVGWKLVRLIGIQPTTRAGSLTPIGYFQSQDDTVAVGATVVWWNQLQSDSVDVMFDNPIAAQVPDSQAAASLLGVTVSSVGNGNIPLFAPADSTEGEDGIGVQGRRFLQTGTYPYHSARYGTSGVLHVLPEFQVP